MSWTPEKVEKLKKLWKQGLTTVEIGRALGISKNAVVGKVHRLQLSGRPSPIKRAGDAQTAKPVAKPVKQPATNKTEVKKTAKTEQKPEKKVEVKAKVSVKETAPVKEKIQQPKAKKENAIVASENMLSLMDLGPTSCRWPIGDPKDEDFHFCDKEAVEGKPYCLIHCAQAYVGVNKFLKGMK